MEELGWSNEPANKTWKRGPNDAAASLIIKTKEHLASVPYRVSLRWLFYRLLQDGFLRDKADYLTYKGIIAKARHSGYIPPDAISDEGRARVRLSGSFDDVEEWTVTLTDQMRNGMQVVDLQAHHDPYVIVAFEAKAMSAQFEQYARPYGVTLWPFGGDPSIPYKYEIATFIRNLDQEVVILYFGDLDDKGQSIGESAMRDVRKWSYGTFTAYLAGLTPEQADEMTLAENPEHPGSYQWEALTDDQAAGLITEALDEFIDLEVIAKARESERVELTRIAARIDEE